MRPKEIGIIVFVFIVISSVVLTFIVVLPYLNRNQIVVENGVMYSNGVVVKVDRYDGEILEYSSPSVGKIRVDLVDSLEMSNRNTDKVLLTSMVSYNNSLYYTDGFDSRGSMGKLVVEENINKEVEEQWVQCFFDRRGVDVALDETLRYCDKIIESVDFTTKPVITYDSLVVSEGVYSYMFTSKGNLTELTLENKVLVTRVSEYPNIKFNESTVVTIGDSTVSVPFTRLEDVYMYDFNGTLVITSGVVDLSVYFEEVI